MSTHQSWDSVEKNMIRQPLISRRILFIAFILLALAATSVAAESWPSTKFEVFEGVPWNSKYTGVLAIGKAMPYNDALDESRPASKPLTPELRYEIEEYLGEVAREYQKYFPAPQLEPLVTREDGARAYRIYYLDIPGSKPALARYSNDCTDDIRFRIEVNAASLTRGGKITPKGYGDLAHELFHAIQRNTVAGKKAMCPGGVGPWIIEGQAEAIGHDMARRLRRLEDDTQVSRWGLRYYSVPLVIPADGPVSRGYQTSSFWRYIAEMQYLRSQGKRDTEAKPGPDLAQGYDTDYSYLADLMNLAPQGSGQKAETKWLGDWTASYFGVDLSRIFIDFVSVFAQYGKYRINGSNLPGSDAEYYWREISFGAKNDLSTRGCIPIKLDEKNDDASVNLSLQKLAADCIELDVGDTGTPLGWTLQAISENKTLLKQLRLAMAGGQQIATSAPIDDIPNASGAVAAWSFLLDPKQKQYLLVANMAKKAQDTVDQDIQLRITLSGRDDNHVPQRAKSTARNVPEQNSTPGPAGASETRARRKAEMVTAIKGSGSTTWELAEAYGNCTGKRTNADCQARVTLKLKSSSADQLFPNSASAAGLGGLHGQMMEMVNVDMGALMAAIEFEDQTPGIEVTINVSGFDYGFTGTFSDASILVSGTNESDWLRSISPAPMDKYPPCLYPNPTGTLTIEEFSPFILRGSYSGQLVKSGIVRNVKKCPTKDIVDSISGSFVIAAPWTQDSRRNIDTSWLMEDAYNDINQMLPAGIKAIDPGTPETPPSFETRDMDFPMEDPDEFGFDECDCSCESIRKGMEITRGGMTGQQPDDEGIQLMMCMGHCMASNPNNCSLDF